MKKNNEFKTCKANIKRCERKRNNKVDYHKIKQKMK